MTLLELYTQIGNLLDTHPTSAQLPVYQADVFTNPLAFETSDVGLSTIYIIMDEDGDPQSATLSEDEADARMDENEHVVPLPVALIGGF